MIALPEMSGTLDPTTQDRINKNIVLSSWHKRPRKGKKLVLSSLSLLRSMPEWRTKTTHHGNDLPVGTHSISTFKLCTSYFPIYLRFA